MLKRESFSVNLLMPDMLHFPLFIEPGEGEQKVCRSCNTEVENPFLCGWGRSTANEKKSSGIIFIESYRFSITEDEEGEGEEDDDDA